ncbi:MAG: 5-bromo-4-chloroindolyl phosphate hydrolysis family protein [Veillonellaceae bacterium]|nr:5-bromo-4-chloroindolyl phosphate hydrolysis family protein [Veillonellaceae bacterium]
MKYLFLIAGVLMMAVCGAVIYGGHAGIGALIGAGSLAMLYMGSHGKWGKDGYTVKLPRELGEIEGASGSDSEELLQEKYHKAVSDFQYIEDMRKKIDDFDLKNQLKKMQGVSGRIIRYLHDNPRKIPIASRFIDYYQDRSAVLVKKYVELYDTKLSTDEVRDTRNRIRSMLFSMDEAYENQFQRLISDQLMDMDAELTVMEQNIRADGIKLESRPELEKPTEKKKPEQTMPHDEADTSVSGNMFDSTLDKIDITEENGKNVLINRGGRHPRRHTDEHLPDASSGKWLRGRNSSGEITKARVIGNKLTAGMLGIFLGGFGVHKFFLGKTALGIIYAAFFWTGIPWIIGIIEGLRYIVMPVDDFFDQYMDKDEL